MKLIYCLLKSFFIISKLCYKYIEVKKFFLPLSVTFGCTGFREGRVFLSEIFSWRLRKSDLCAAEFFLEKSLNKNVTIIWN